MPVSDPRNLVSTEWLATHIDAPDVRVVDASWYLPGAKRDPKAEFAAEHIPGAVFFDIDEICDTASPYPHMLPSAEKFSSRVSKIGLGDGVRIVIYDGAGLFSAARVWWMFKVMGHDDVAVLDGGLPKWKAEGRALSDRPAPKRERHLTARMNTLRLKSVEEVAASVERGDAQILDARGPGRFTGVEAEPRPGLRSGHIPGSRNIPFTTLLNADGTMKPREVLADIFAEKGVNMRKPVITSCGSGVTAAIVALALDTLGHRMVAVYDGSWAEWGSRADLPMETGA